MALDDQIDDLALRVATEINSVRAETPGIEFVTKAEYDGLTPDPDTLYVVSDGISSVGQATLASGGINIDANQFDAANLTLTGTAVTLNYPTGGRDYRTIQIAALASGGNRTFNFHASYLRLEGVDASYPIPSGKILRASLRRIDVTGSVNWVVEAVGITQ